MNGQLTLAVIGHVDHGKTAIVRALTGVNTDRLAEERSRGLSIVLGFSFIEKKNGDVIDLIDTPGHEDFVRTMISGAAGVDGAMLVVAANEGVMPQTREHLDIAQLLGLQNGVVVLNKADLATGKRLETVRQQVAELISGTFLEDAPFVQASTQTGKGIAELRSTLESLEAKDHTQPSNDKFFLPIDRAFVMRGFGPVVTGTLRGNRIDVGGRVEILPGNLVTTIRGIQVHNSNVESAWPGQRVAVNLRNVKADDVRHGCSLASPGAFQPSRRIDVELNLLKSQSSGLRNGAAVRLLVGTSEAMARIRLLDHHELQPGASGLTQLRLDRPITTRLAENFVIRNYSPAQTIGGGTVIDPNAERHKRFDSSVTDRLATLTSGELDEILKSELARAGFGGLSEPQLRDSLRIDRESLSKALDSLNPVRIGNERFVDRDRFGELRNSIVRLLSEFHKANPRIRNAAIANIGKQINLSITDDAFRFALDQLVTDGHIVKEKDSLRLPAFDPFAELDGSERQIATQIEKSFLEADITPPDVNLLIGKEKNKRAIFQLLLQSGQLIRLRTHDRNRNLVLHAQTLERVIDQFHAEFDGSNGFAASDARDVLGSTRKHVLPILEHLDASGITIRIGNLRRFKQENTASETDRNATT